MVVEVVVVAQPNSFQLQAPSRKIKGLEGVKWPITQSLDLKSRVDRTARHPTMPINWTLPGQAILKLLHKAAGVAEANSRQALETAQKLSAQLEAAKDRIAELESEVGHYQEKAERAEEWLHKISAEIEDRLIREPEERRREAFR